VAGLSEIAAALRKREWEKRTQYLVLLLLERAEEELAGLQEAAYDVLVGSLAEENRGGVLPIGPAFHIPVGAVQLQYFVAATELVQDANNLLDKVYWEADRERDELMQAIMEKNFKAIHRSLDDIGAAVQDLMDEQASEVAPPTAKPQPASQPLPQAPDAVSEPVDDIPDAPPPPGGEVPQRQDRPAAPVDQRRGKGPLKGLKALELSRHADRAVADLRDRWASLEDTIGQLSGLLDSDGARTLLEASLQASLGVRQAIWKYKPSTSQPDGGPRDEDVKLQVAQRVLWHAGRARAASEMVIMVLMTGFILLQALDDVFSRRVGDFPGAADHRTSKEQFDKVDADLLRIHQEMPDLPNVDELRQALEELFRERATSSPDRPRD
jgi:hypothetical protein